MSKFSTPLQQAVYSALNGSVGYPVYDAVPQLPDGQPLSDFPYIAIGNDTQRPFDSDSFIGSDATLTLHVWSRAKGKKETKEIMAAIYNILHRGIDNLSAAGYTFVDSLFEYSDIFEEEDGVTRHGVCRYRITLTEE